MGEVTGDVYLNDTVFWANVPNVVWAYTIGGYQVMKKWLRYWESAATEALVSTPAVYLARRMIAFGHYLPNHFAGHP